MPGLQDLSLVFVAYLIGSIPFGLLISQVVGRVDIRRFGSGNIGTANVLRIVGKRAAALTLLGDLLKGFLPTLAALLLGGSELLVAGVGLAAVLGHNWSVYLRFAGGKGVATSFGALFAMTPLDALNKLADLQRRLDRAGAEQGETGDAPRPYPTTSSDTPAKPAEA